MRRHREMHDPPAIMSQHQKHLQDLEADRRHGEEVHRHHTLHVSVEERPPGLGRRSPAADHVLTHAGLADFDVELQCDLTHNFAARQRYV